MERLHGQLAPPIAHTSLTQSPGLWTNYYTRTRLPLVTARRRNRIMAPKVIIVTGASRGIGLAVAELLISKQHKVVLAARSKEQLEALRTQHPEQVECIAADLGDVSVRSQRAAVERQRS